MEDMAKRTQDTAIQQQALEGKPEAIARDIKALDESSHALLEAAEAQQAAERGAEDALRQAEARHAQTGEALASAREARAGAVARAENQERSEEHTSELQSLMRISYAVFCLKKKTKQKQYA